MNNGWISVHRRMIDWEWFNDSRIVHIFIYCLLKANHAPKKWRGVQVNRGQFITSVAHLSEDLGISTQQIRTALKKLKSTNELTIKTTNKFTMISITNYEEYQDTNKQTNKQLTNEQQTTNKQVTTNNNDNNDNNEIKRTTLSGKPDVACKKKSTNNNDAKDLILYLNEKADKNFRLVDTHIVLANARLREGNTVEEIKGVIDMKVQEWKGTDNHKWLRPETLFGARKFNQYIGEKPMKPAQVAPYVEMIN